MHPSRVTETDAGRIFLFLGDWTDVPDSGVCDPSREHAALDVCWRVETANSFTEKDCGLRRQIVGRSLFFLVQKQTIGAGGAPLKGQLVCGPKRKISQGAGSSTAHEEP